MTRSQLKKAIEVALGHLHWAKYHRELKESGKYQNPENLFGLQYDPDKLQAELKALLARKQRRDFTEDRNSQGNVIISWFRGGAGRYHWDFGPCRSKFGWAQYDTRQDASYFGVWVHLKRRLVLTYCEGDVSLVKCATDDQLRAELKSMEECYGPPPPAFYTADALEAVNGGIAPSGNVTAYYDTRPSLPLIPA